LSYAPPVSDGWSRLLSRVTSIALLPAALTALQSGQPLWVFLGVSSVVAFESNRHRLPSTVRLLAVVAQLACVCSLVALGVTAAFYAESGRQAPFLRGLAVLVVLALAVMALRALVGAVRTLAPSLAQRS
jgi:hypothetical protein